MGHLVLVTYWVQDHLHMGYSLTGRLPQVSTFKVIRQSFDKIFGSQRKYTEI